jgi:hypothetical protein
MRDKFVHTMFWACVVALVANLWGEFISDHIHVITAAIAAIPH